MTSKMNKMFDRDEMMRLSREGMENSMKFFMTVNENLFKVQDFQREALNEATKKNLELLNKTCEDYQKNTRIIVGRIETMWNQVSEQVNNTKEKAAE